MGENTPTEPADALAASFIARWQGVQLTDASELATSQTFVIQLCELLGVPQPLPTGEYDYMFERPITFVHGDGATSAGRIDCYRHGAFVWESKKLRNLSLGSQRFDTAMMAARNQAENYARALPATEGRPPFLLVVDVGNVIELYAEFSKSGATYTPFPDPRSHRIPLADLARADVRTKLRTIWLDADSLNPALASARVTRAVATQLAELAKSLEATGHRADHVGAFLTRCLFSMFAEDVELLPKGSFMALLQKHQADPATLQHMLRALWADMDRGGFSTALAHNVLRFNGKLFKESNADGYALLLTPAQVGQLISAAQANWREVEPAIFGTLLERALDPTERHSLGAHYTPRAYVERLVIPTIIDPLRADWANVQAAAVVLATDGKLAEARAEVRQFHHQLCTLRVLDPACGSGNFLYVTLEHLKRLEGEVLNQLDALGLDTDATRQDALGLEGETVTLQQLRGIELNDRAAALAELVLWIGYLQWHIRTRGNTAVAEPVVHDYGNIECRDAVLAWDEVEPARDAHGQVVMRWDGKTKKKHPATGEEVPDETAQIAQWHYVRPRKATWPNVDYIVGNPPYLGARTIRDSLGEGYLAALRAVNPQIPANCDFVMYWWSKAAEATAAGKCKQFGLIATNGLAKPFNRRISEKFVGKSVSVVFAVPDHPWVDSTDGASVRVALTVGRAGLHNGKLLKVTAEKPLEDGEIAVETSVQFGAITAGLAIGVDTAKAPLLMGNRGMSCVGYQLTGKGFVVNEAQAKQLDAEFGTPQAFVKPLLTGRDIMQDTRRLFAIDLFGMDEMRLRTDQPAMYQWVLERVKPERDHNTDSASNSYWWTFARPRQDFRLALRDCDRAVVTSLTAKHRVFVAVSSHTICDSTTVMFALPDNLHFGVLSSSVHVQWSLAPNNRLGVGNDPRYIKSVCFENFPFPDEDTGLTPALHQTIGQLAEQIDAHRKRQQAAHPGLTLTGMYNVLEALREGRALTAKERIIHDHGLVAVLKELHDELDAAVLCAYGMDGLAAADWLQRLAELNARRAAEERQGRVRWLRPAFQDPASARVAQQSDLALETAPSKASVAPAPSAASAAPASGITQPWPAALPDQVRALATVLAAHAGVQTLPEIEARFKGRGPWKRSLPRILDTLEALGRASRVGTGWRG